MKRPSIRLLETVLYGSAAVQAFQLVRFFHGWSSAEPAAGPAWLHAALSATVLAAGSAFIAVCLHLGWIAGGIRRERTPFEARLRPLGLTIGSAAVLYAAHWALVTYWSAGFIMPERPALALAGGLSNLAVQAPLLTVLFLLREILGESSRLRAAVQETL